MKNSIQLKLLILFNCIIFGLTNCSEPEYRDTNVQSQNGINNNAKFDYINEFTYKNHDYIMFKTGGMNSATAGIVHNPECKYCNGNKESTISKCDSLVKQTTKM